MMFRCLICIALGLSVSAIAIQVRKPDSKKPPVKKPVRKPSVHIAAQGQGWSKSKMTIQELAGRVSSATSKLSGINGDLKVDAETPDGIASFVTPSIALRIRDKSHFRVDYVVVQNVPFSASLVRNGANRWVRLDNDIRKLNNSGPLPAAASVTGDRLVGLFDMDFPRLVFQGLTEGADAWKPVLLGWAKGVDGYKPVVEERRMTFKGVNYLNYRVRAERTGVAKAKLGPSTFEVVLDGKRFLPVTIRNVRKDSKGGNWMILWAAIYRFDQKISDSELSMGK